MDTLLPLLQAELCASRASGAELTTAAAMGWDSHDRPCPQCGDTRQALAVLDSNVAAEQSITTPRNDANNTRSCHGVVYKVADELKPEDPPVPVSVGKADDAYSQGTMTSTHVLKSIRSLTRMVM